MSDINYILRSDQVAARRIGDELMIMTAKESAVFSLNETAALLWEAADGVTPLAQIVERDICSQFDIEASAALADARETLHNLAKLGIVQVSSEPIG